MSDDGQDSTIVLVKASRAGVFQLALGAVFIVALATALLVAWPRGSTDPPGLSDSTPDWATTRAGVFASRGLLVHRTDEGFEFVVPTELNEGWVQIRMGEITSMGGLCRVVEPRVEIAGRRQTVTSPHDDNWSSRLPGNLHDEAGVPISIRIPHTLLVSERKEGEKVHGRISCKVIYAKSVDRYRFTNETIELSHALTIHVITEEDADALRELGSAAWRPVIRTLFVTLGGIVLLASVVLLIRGASLIHHSAAKKT